MCITETALELGYPVVKGKANRIATITMSEKREPDHDTSLTARFRRGLGSLSSRVSYNRCTESRTKLNKGSLPSVDENESTLFLNQQSEEQSSLHRLVEDRRAVASQIGLMLAIFVALGLLTVAQVTWAPSVREDTDYTHARQSLADMEDVQVNSIRAATGGHPQSSVVRMGDTYPSYLILVQPSGPSGSMHTTDGQTMGIENAQATNEETADYLNGGRLSFESTRLEYSPNYAEYDRAPDIALAGTSLYQQYDNRTNIVANSNLVDGRSLNLFTATGDINRGQSNPMMLQTTPLSSSKSDVRVNADTNGDGNPDGHIQLQLQTELTLEDWEEMLAGEIDDDTSAASPAYDGDNRHIAQLEMDESTDPNTLIVHLENDVPYRLNMARVGYRMSEQASFSQDEVPDVAYLTTVSNPSPVVNEGNRVELTVQVRDEFNNPVSDQMVEVQSPHDTDVNRHQQLSDSEGTVTFTYTAPDGISSDRTEDVTVQIQGMSGDEAEVTFEVQVQDTG